MTTKGRTPPRTAETHLTTLDELQEQLRQAQQADAESRAQEYRAICEREGERLRCGIIGVPKFVLTDTGWVVDVEIVYGAKP